MFMAFFSQRNLFSLAVGKKQLLLWCFCRGVEVEQRGSLSFCATSPSAFLHPNHKTVTDPELK